MADAAHSPVCVPVQIASTGTADSKELVRSMLYLLGTIALSPAGRATLASSGSGNVVLATVAKYSNESDELFKECAKECVSVSATLSFMQCVAVVVPRSDWRSRRCDCQTVVDKYTVAKTVTELGNSLEKALSSKV